MDTIKSESPNCRRVAAEHMGGDESVAEDDEEAPASARTAKPPILLPKGFMGRFIFIGQLGPRNETDLVDIFAFQ